MVIGGSAHKHGVADADILHAVRLSMVTLFTRNNVTMLLGPAHDGQIPEIGILDLDDDPYVIHAMPMRRNYQRCLR